MTNTTDIEARSNKITKPLATNPDERHRRFNALAYLHSELRGFGQRRGKKHQRMAPEQRARCNHER